MDQDQLRTLLEGVREGTLDVDAALGRMRHLPFEDLGFAKVDHHRLLRHGMPEVIFAQGKTAEQVVAIALRNTLPQFLASAAKPSILVKFIRDRLDLSRTEGTSLAA